MTSSESINKTKTIKAAVLSMTSTSDKSRNVDTAFGLVRKAAEQGADWVQLPEIFAYHGPYEKIYEMAEFEDGPLSASLAALAQELGIVLIAGSSGERPDRDLLSDTQLLNRDGHRRVYNTTYIYGRDGSILSKYRKAHLFNLLGDDGRPSHCESDGFIPGNQCVTTEIDGFLLAHSICYDLRFPEFFTKLASVGRPDVLIAPSAFTKATGEAHWELLLRSRAVEWQCYMYAANQVGMHAPGKESYGHSMIVDPWGKILADTGDAPGIAMASISRTVIDEVRAKLPALLNRRPELYV